MNIHLKELQLIWVLPLAKDACSIWKIKTIEIVILILNVIRQRTYCHNFKKL